MPQCELKIDDVPFLSFITSWISGVDKYQQDNSLPVARSVDRVPRSASRKTSSGLLARLRSHSYYYISPMLAVLGMFCAIALLIYQAGWTVSAISSRMQYGAERAVVSSTIFASSPSAKTLETGALSKYLQLSNGTTFASKALKRSIPVVPYIDAVPMQQSLYQYDGLGDSGTMLLPLVCLQSCRHSVFEYNMRPYAYSCSGPVLCFSCLKR